MLRTRSRHVPFIHSDGDGTISRQFVESISKKAVREITDASGNVISREEIDVPVYRTIPLDQQLHPLSETADKYDIYNLQRAGVTPKLMTKPYVALSLDQLSVVSASADAIDFDNIVNNDVETE